VEESLIDANSLNWVHERLGDTGGSRKRVVREAAGLGKAEEAEQALASSSQPLDVILLAVTVMIVGFGATMVYSSSSVIAAEKFGGPAHFMVRQVTRAVLGFLCLLAALFIPVDRVRKYFPHLAFASFSLLLLPALFSVAYKGARSWVNLLGVTLQPSEIVKFALILYLADRLTKHQERLESLKDGVLPLIGLICIPLGIIVLEPDVGTAVAMASVFGVMMFVANIRMRHILPLMGAVALAVYVLIIIEPYRLKRLEAGYQIQQGFVAMGSGGLLGRGLGRSIQKYFFLPEPYTDSILPVIGEEFGFIGTVAVVLLFCLFGWRGLRIAYQQATLFRFLLATGLTANILMYALLNMAVMTALLPTTGLPLPFISYGGSSLVLNLAGTGLLLNLSRQRRLREGEEEVKEDTE